MSMSRLIASVATLTLLAACNGGGASVSGSASESAGSSSGLSSLWEKVKGLTVENGRTIEMPAAALEADAFLNAVEFRGGNFEAIGRDLIFDSGRPIPAFDTALAGAIANMRGELADGKVSLPKGGTLDADHLGFAIPILIAMQPRKGWEVNAIDDRRVDPEFDTPFFRAHRPPSRYDEDAHLRYMEMLAICAVYANDVFARIGEALGGVRLADPEDVQRRVLATYRAIPTADLKASLEAAAKRVIGGSFATDLTGSHNIHFTHSAIGDFVGDARGMTWTKSGGVWFGDGRISGRSVTFRLASTSSLSQRQAQSGTQGTSDEAKVEGSGQIAPR